MKNTNATPLSGANPLCPNRMTADARRAELGRILAAGVIRLNAAKSSFLSVENGDSSLHFRPEQSGTVAPTHRRSA